MTVKLINGVSKKNRRKVNRLLQTPKSLTDEQILGLSLLIKSDDSEDSILVDEIQKEVDKEIIKLICEKAKNG